MANYELAMRLKSRWLGYAGGRCVKVSMQNYRGKRFQQEIPSLDRPWQGDRVDSSENEMPINVDQFEYSIFNRYVFESAFVSSLSFFPSLPFFRSFSK